MKIYETVMWVFALWALCEGTAVVGFPKLSLRVTRALFPKRSEFLERIQPEDLRKLGWIELAFGLLLGGYLLVWA